MRISLVPLGFVSLLLLAGCASQKGNNMPQPLAASVPGALIRPGAIYVYDFNLDLSKIKTDGQRPQLIEFRKMLRASITRQLVEMLNREVVPAYPYDKDLPLPAGNNWLLDGRVLQVDEENNALSLYLGKGAGRHTSEAYVEIAGLKKYPPERLMIFDSSGQPETGKLETTDAKVAIDADAGRIARLVSGYLKEYFVKQGWTGSGEAVPALGSQPPKAGVMPRH